MKVAFLVISPNPRQRFHNKTEDIADILAKDNKYRYDIFSFVAENNSQSYTDKSLSENNQMRRIKSFHPVDIEFNRLIGILDNIYCDKTNLDNLRGAVLEMFIVKVCEQLYGKTNTYRESYLEIDGHKSANTIDIGIRDGKKTGKCFECKLCGLSKLFKRKKVCEQIENLKWIIKQTNEKFSGIIATFVDKRAFELMISRAPHNISLEKIDIYGRAELINMEML